MTDAITTTQAEKPEPIVNIAAYKFVELNELDRRRRELKLRCAELELRGTILLSGEGINLFVAGARASIDGLLELLRGDWGLTDLEVKESVSDKQPFNRMLVKRKREIIAFGVRGIEPQKSTSPKLPPRELRRWLDEGKPLRLLDVRNDYEVDLGTFRGSEKLGISHFREFPGAISRMPEEAKQQPVVMFCTGGIRCEKAGPLLEQQGFREVYQLDGGILKYFEQCGGKHYDGACFVFDGRVALDAQLQPTGEVLCYACQAVLSHEDLQSPLFEFAKSCPHCYRTPDEHLSLRLAKRMEQLQKICSPLPGCIPYDNYRRMHVARRFAGWKLIDFLAAYHPPTSIESWRAWIAAGEITEHGVRVSEDTLVSEGATFQQIMRDTVEPAVNAKIEMLYEDDSLIIVNKPAPLPIHPSGRFNRNTLHYLLSQIYHPQKLRFAHRLDANTSGLVIVCRKRSVASKVQPQFESQTVEKIYLAKIHGHPNWDFMKCDAPIASEPAEVGSRSVADVGLAASTEFRVVARLPDETSCVEIRPLTGRTNQIRIHARHLKHPVVGDPLYHAGPLLGEHQTLEIDASPMCLHCHKLTFQHPESGESVTFEAPRPEWFCSAALVSGF